MGSPQPSSQRSVEQPAPSALDSILNSLDVATCLLLKTATVALEIALALPWLV